MNGCAVCDFRSKVRLRTFGCVVMGSAMLFIFLRLYQMLSLNPQKHTASSSLLGVSLVLVA